MSLEGTVLETTEEILKLKLNIDEKQDINKVAWFKFAPPTGNILYSMPLVGDNVMLYFQNEYDRPVVTGCVRKNGATFGRCANPNNRYYATESGNYLDMLPGAINFYRGGMNVSFNDESGISLSSNNNLNIGTQGGISMSAGSVSISGSNKVIVSKGKGGFISLEGELYNEGTVVHEIGSCRELFAPFTDDVPDLDELLAIKSQINFNKFNPSADLISAASGNEAILCGVNKEKSENGELPTFNVNGKFNEGDRVNVIINGKEFPATVKLKNDGGIYAEVDDYSGSIEAGIEAGEKSKPSAKLLGLAALDNVSNDIIGLGKCIPTFARWFGETTGLGDENSYRANTEEIERLEELQEGIHDFFKENSGDEETFELMSQAIQYASMAGAVGGIGFGVVASVPKIGKSIVKNGKKISELFGDSKKIINKVEDLFDDLEGWFKKAKNKEATEGGSGTNGGGKADNVITDADRIKQFNLNNCRGQMKDDLSKFRNKLLNDEDAVDISKICSTVDVGDLSLKGEAGSGIWSYNPTIKDYTGVDPREFCETVEEYNNYYRHLLSDSYLDDLPNSFWSGKNETFIREDMAKLRDAIERTKNEAANLKPPNQFGEPSFEYRWNIDNCAEIWSSRDAILKGARYDDLVYRTENLRGGFAEPCENCKITFEGTYNIDS